MISDPVYRSRSCRRGASGLFGQQVDMNMIVPTGGRATSAHSTTLSGLHLLPEILRPRQARQEVRVDPLSMTLQSSGVKLQVSTGRVCVEIYPPYFSTSTSVAAHWHVVGGSIHTYPIFDVTATVLVIVVGQRWSRSANVDVDVIKSTNTNSTYTNKYKYKNLCL